MRIVHRGDIIQRGDVIIRLAGSNSIRFGQWRLRHFFRDIQHNRIERINGLHHCPADGFNVSLTFRLCCLGRKLNNNLLWDRLGRRLDPDRF